MKVLFLVLALVFTCSAQIFTTSEEGWHRVDGTFASNVAVFDANQDQVPILLTPGGFEFYAPEPNHIYSQVNSYRIGTSPTPYRVISQENRQTGKANSIFRGLETIKYEMQYISGQWRGALANGTVQFYIGTPYATGNGRVKLDKSIYLDYGPVNLFWNGEAVAGDEFDVAFLPQNILTIQTDSYVIVDSITISYDRTSGSSTKVMSSDISILSGGLYNVDEAILVTNSVTDRPRGRDKTPILYYNFQETKSVTLREPESWNNAPAQIVIISDPALLNQAYELASRKNVPTKVVTPQMVYDNFTSGLKTPEAFKKMLAAEPDLQFVILFGDATYDPKGISGPSNDVIPTFFVSSTFGYSPSDSAMVDFDGDSIEDVPIGRIPARTAEEALLYIGKLDRYDTINKNNLIVADQWFEISADTMANSYSTVLKRVDYTSGFRQEITSNFNLGKYFVLYLGHGSTICWNNFFCSSDFYAAVNNQLSVVMAGSCLNGYFISHEGRGVAEASLFSQNGAVAYMSSTATVYASTGNPVSQRFMDGMYSLQTVGEVAMESKRIPVADRQTYVLLGDPTILLDN